MNKQCHVISKNASTTNPISWCFSGTRGQCEKWCNSRAVNHFYVITTISSMDKARRRYGH
jgi:hypothetical protein